MAMRMIQPRYRDQSVVIMTVLMSASILLRSSVFAFRAGRAPALRQSTNPFAGQKHLARPFSIDQRSFSLSAASTKSTTGAAASEKAKAPVPMTLISGFLGTGKTSTLKHLLENKQDLKIGVIVNDMAAINIDARLVSSQTDSIVELQNGCACCSLSDELFTSVETLMKGRDLDSIVIELSGVADPAAIKSNWIMAPPAIKKQADIARIVTLVDAGTFGTDYLTWDNAGERPGWVDPGDDCAANRKVAELLAEQVEAANLILVNKVDLASDEEILTASTVARALNEKAELVQVEFGAIDPMQILGILGKPVPVVQAEESHSHDHADHEAACEEPACTDPSHSHSHNHEHAAAEATCEEPACTDPTHSHSHGHEHAEEAACEDAACTDTSHSHDHKSHATSMNELGISSFVFKAALPFSSRRLMKLLNQWPVPVKDTLDIKLLQEAQQDGYDVDGFRIKDSPFVGVIRSKGFCWFAPEKWSGANEDAWRHDTANYWSHAGKHFSITSAGKWWGSIPKDKMKQMMGGNLKEYERALREDFVSEEFGDRRQEIVFIGTNLNDDDIAARLNECLLTPKELDKYRQSLGNYLATIMTTSASGLFDVGSIDHTDL
jgi:G3E family GTPase